MRLTRALLISLCVALSGCVAGVLAMGAAVGAVVYEQRSVEMIQKDTKIAHDLNDALVRNDDFQESRIVASSYNRIVLLVGQTPIPSVRAKAERVAHAIPGVRRVYDQITIGDPISLNRQTQDAWITSQAKAKMLTKSGLKSGSFKVVTENGVVYLIGRVTHDQANMAVNISRNIKGVRKVVKIFTYTD